MIFCHQRFSQDLKPQEREVGSATNTGHRTELLQIQVMGAFVVFWCERTRDAVLGQYGWSRKGLKRVFLPQHGRNADSMAFS